VTISVIIPVWNAERYLASALESVRAQTLAPLEIIVVDDGSTDGAKQIALGGGARYLLQEHKGVGAARNLGVQSAVGECVAFLDADDLWLPEKLERQWQYLQRHPEVGVVFAAIEQFVSEDTPHVQREVNVRLGVHVAPLISTMLARKQCFEETGPFPAIQGGDWAMWLHAAQQNGTRIHTLETCLARRRIHDQNMSRVFRQEIQRDYLRLLRMHWETTRARDSNE
jgi:glycosyltransferase involved in cell wall biosynthesis